MTPEFAAGYLSAMIDGEGSVIIRGDGKPGPVGIYNTEIAIIQACEEACTAFGVGYQLGVNQPKGTNRPLFKLEIARRAEIERLLTIVDLRHPGKADRLKRLPTLFVDRVRVSKEQLERWYLTERRNGAEIARTVGVGQTTVSAWLRRHNIPSRGHGRQHVAKA